jgi:Holliday junction resolvase RusA-like endonuclease
MTIDTTDPAAVRAEAKRRQQLRDQGATTFDEEMREVYLMSARGLETPVVTKVIGPVETSVRAIRWIDGMRATIAAAPRTKKNSKRHYALQSAAYVVYRDRIINGFLPLLAGLELPLPDRDYNLRATFFVDRKGEQADLVGLLQGLADALENAGVVSNDRWFRAFDGSRMIAGDPAPRVELEIRPL